MKSFTLFFCESGESAKRNIESYYSDKPFVTVKVVQDAEQYLSAGKPDVAVISEDFNYLPLIRLFAANRPKIILACKEESDEMEKVPHDAVVFKPYSLNDVTEIAAGLAEGKEEKIKLVGNKAIDEKLSNIFIRAGIPPHIKGYQYLRTAVKFAIDRPDIVNSITKKLYPAVAEYYDTTPSKVERAIRHAIEVAWSRGRIENINAIFGIKIYGKGDKPTNGELIALVADKMVIELMPE